MTDETATDTDDEEEQNRELIAWLKATLVALLARVRAAVAQSVEEIAPQVRGTLDRLHIPAGAVKPLALAAVLVVAAVAMPAAPFAGYAGNGSTQEPVTGETYDPAAGEDLREVVTDRIEAATTSAPAPPSDVRTSAGSQTMSVETSVVDGDPAIVLEDDRTHDGRWVAIETSWFQEELGEVPQTARIAHESDGTYSTPVEVRGEEAAFYVEGFSTNTVTFDGVLSVSASPAVDGDTISYDAPNGGDDLSIDLTGVNNMRWSNKTSSVTSDTTLSVDAGGTTDPSQSSITVTAGSDGSLSAIDAYTNGGTYEKTAMSDGVGGIEQRFDDPPNRINEITVQTGVAYSETGTVDVYIDSGGPDTDYTDGELVASDVTLSSDGEPDVIQLDNQYNPSGDKITVNFALKSGFTDNSYRVMAAEPTSQSEAWSSTRGSTNNDLVMDMTLGYAGGLESLSANASDTDDSASFTNLASGESVTKPIDLTLDTSNVSISTSGPADVSLNKKEVSQTVDPVVEYNGQTASYDGTLADGETTSLTVNDSWIESGTNDLSVSLPSVSSGPVPQVGVDVTHDVSESRTIDYSAEAFSERYTTSKTWAENTSNATLTVPWASSSVVAVRDVSVTYEDSTGSEPSPRPTPTHRLENGSVVVELGDVEAGWTTEISAAGSKVQVDGAELEVVNATAAGEDLDSRIRLNNPSEDTYIRVGSTEQGQQLHYLANASWDNGEASQIRADGTNEIRIPNAPDNGEAQLRTLPLAFDVGSGAIDVDIPDGRVNEQQPVYRVSPGDSTGDTYDVTYVDAADGQPYVLYDETDEIVLDQGLASSPLTLSATEPEETHTIQFREDDGSATGSGGSGPVGAIGPMVTTSSPFSGFTGLLPGPNIFLIGLAGLAGLGIVARQTRLFNEGTTSDAIADSAASVGERGGELLGRALSNQLVLAALTLGGGVWLLTSGAFTPTERLIISIGTVPVAMFLVLQQFGQFDIRVWAGSTAVIAVLGIQAIAPEVFTTIAEEAGIVIVAGALILGWRALSAWRAEASTPDTVNRLSISTEDEDDT